MGIFYNSFLAGLNNLVGSGANAEQVENQDSCESVESLILRCYTITDKYQTLQPKTNMVDLRQLFRTEMIKMAYLISLADGRVDKPELSTISNAFSVILTEEALQANYYEDCSVEDNFFTRVPEFIQRIAQLEKDSRKEYPTMLADTRFLYRTMKQFAHVMMMCDGYRMKLEVAMIDRLMNATVHYINEKESEPETSVKSENTGRAEGDFIVNALDGIEEMNELLGEIDSLIGLEGVKQEIHNLVNLLMVRKIRENKGLNQPSIAMHLVFTGNPGTGKTTIARKLAQIYRCLGILDKGTLVETDRAGLVAGYMGQTAGKVQDLCRSALGGILFIDEAYALTDAEGKDDFGQEAVNTLLKIMEDQRENFIVIVAGYPEPMERFLDSNPGLRSRFNRYIHFENYSVDELYKIFMDLCNENDYTIEAGVEEALLASIQKLIENGGSNFANARDVRNYFDRVCSNQANRVISMQQGDMSSFMMITEADL